MARYLEVADRSGVFAPGATDQVKGRSPLCVMWLEHLLQLSMLQHPSGAWTWGRFVMVHPAGNVDVVAGCDRYRGLLVDQSTFAPMTIEDLLDSHALPKKTEAALRTRYLVTQRGSFGGDDELTTHRPVDAASNLVPTRLSGRRCPRRLAAP